ncbi:putative ABC transport system ATP-binding protein [Natronobacillus azotifigens]|uniref:ABC transporter ATP-binding protein n=1 Tax=Natronobacillus azotifigens TaxID=472978 RepID=A0A9J6R9J7_9BACI|nr:ABC transporter ATP-binding protein [Natronobacillus azotifigens]MCZ0702277.1 ABC transporter ATP-binding protein [Natronobacillus azotifigens]
MAYITFKEVSKNYTNGEVAVSATQQVSFEIEKGEFVVILGPSGAGKTTVLNLLGGMDTTSSGKITVDNQEISNFSKKKLTDYRRNDVGFVFQFYNLVPNLTALENIELGAEISNNPLSATEMLNKVGLGERLQSFPGQLSGGEQQRVAIARALTKNPRLLLCDEPTGALDSKTGKNVMMVLKEVANQLGHTLIMVTHNPEFAKSADKVIHMQNGRIKKIDIVENPLHLEALEW